MGRSRRRWTRETTMWARPVSGSSTSRTAGRGPCGRNCTTWAFCSHRSSRTSTIYPPASGAAIPRGRPWRKRIRRNGKGNLRSKASPKVSGTGVRLYRTWSPPDPIDRENNSPRTRPQGWGTILPPGPWRRGRRGRRARRRAPASLSLRTRSSDTPDPAGCGGNSAPARRGAPWPAGRGSR